MRLCVSLFCLLISFARHCYPYSDGEGRAIAGERGAYILPSLSAPPPPFHPLSFHSISLLLSLNLMSMVLPSFKRYCTLFQYSPPISKLLTALRTPSDSQYQTQFIVPIFSKNIFTPKKMISLKIVFF